MKISTARLYFTLIIIILNLVFINYTFISSQPAYAAVPGYIIGRVTLPDGTTGVSGCEVTLVGNNTFLAKITTDDYGNFYLTNIEPNGNTYYYRINAVKSGWGKCTSRPFSVTSDNSTTVILKMYPDIGYFDVRCDKDSIDADNSSTANLSVVIKDLKGDPVPDGYHVVFSQSSYYPDPGFFVSSDNKSKVTLTVTGGSISLKYGMIPLDSLSRKVTINAQVLEFPEVTKSIDLPINLVSPNVITGVVYDAEMKPVPFAHVYLTKWDGVSQYRGYNSSEDLQHANDGSSITDAYGVYRYEVLPVGDYKITASDSVFNNTTANIQVIRGTYKQNIVIPGLKYGSIEGMVFDNNATPVGNASVTLSRVRDGKLEKVSTVLSDSEGKFSFGNNRYGPYNLEAVYSGVTANAPLWLDVDKAVVNVIYSNPLPSPPLPAPTQEPASPQVPTSAPSPTPEAPANVLYSFGIAVIMLSGICAIVLVISLTAIRK